MGPVMNCRAIIKIFNDLREETAEHLEQAQFGGEKVAVYNVRLLEWGGGTFVFLQR